MRLLTWTVPLVALPGAPEDGVSYGISNYSYWWWRSHTLDIWTNNNGVTDTPNNHNQYSSVREQWTSWPLLEVQLFNHLWWNLSAQLTVVAILFMGRYASREATHWEPLEVWPKYSNCIYLNVVSNHMHVSHAFANIDGLWKVPLN